MLTRFVRTQLVIFTTLSIVGLVLMFVQYIQVPTLLGLGRLTVTLELPRSGGLYRFANVNYRGVHVGEVTDIALTPTGAQATLSLQTSPRIPADLVAEVRSLSAIGEQFVDLLPHADAPPYLHDGSVITQQNAHIPQPVGPMLDKVSAMLGSIPEGKLDKLIDETSTAFNDSAFDLGSLMDSSSKISAASADVAGQTRSLIDDSAVLLDGQVQSADATRTWARSLAGLTGQLNRNDAQLREIMRQGPPALNEVSNLLDQVKPTLPVLLANMTTLGQIAVTYHPGLEQLFVLLPPYVSYIQSSSGTQNATGLAMANFRLVLGDPPACTVGFLPPSEWRSPADETTIDTPDDLYCKLPQDAPLVVRGARNLPCMGHPGKRAPTVAICDSDREYEPTAMRQHVLGPYPFDPNLVSQGVPLDSRVPGEHEAQIFAPIEGTPIPGGVALPVETPSPDATPPAPPSSQVPQSAVPNSVDPTAPHAGAQTSVAPSGFVTGGSGPSVAVANYDPRTGRYLAPDGVASAQTDLVKRPESWRDLLLADS
jgi:phospholipid/cholesterol/gamma-HCH transport system substrate-binding protein